MEERISNCSEGKTPDSCQEAKIRNGVSGGIVCDKADCSYNNGVPVNSVLNQTRCIRGKSILFYTRDGV